jgi:putative membrane protein
MDIKLILIAAVGLMMSHGRLRSADEDFIKKASEANMAEIEAGQLATEKGASAELKAFADSMVIDHGVAQKELIGIAKKESVTLSRSPDTEHGKMIERISRLSGPGFDSVYLHMQLLDHQVAVQLFQEEASSGKDPLAKGYAGKYLPKLRHHLMMVKGIRLR